MKTIDLDKLEYGIDFFALPPNIIVFEKTKDEILNKISENKNYGTHNINNPIYKWKY